MNEQTKSAIRNVMQFLGGSIIGGVILQKLGITMEQLSTVVEALGTVSSAVALIWGVWRTRQAGIVHAAAKIVDISAKAQIDAGVPAAKVASPS